MSGFDKVFPGQRMNMPAGIYNEILDALAFIRELRNHTGGGSGGGGLLAGYPEIKNDSDEDHWTGEVLGIEDIWPPPGDTSACKFGKKILHCVTPAAKHWGRYAVLLEPIAKGKTGLACITGFCPARLIISDEDATHCDIYPGDATGLRAGFTGTAEILQKELGTGSCWAYVRLGVAPPDIPFSLKGKLKRGETAPALVLRRSDYQDTITEITVKDARSSWPEAEEKTGGEARVKVGKDGLVYEIVDLFCKTT